LCGKIRNPKDSGEKIRRGSSPGGLYNKLLLFALWFSGTGVFFSVFFSGVKNSEKHLRKSPISGGITKKFHFSGPIFAPETTAHTMCVFSSSNTGRDRLRGTTAANKHLITAASTAHRHRDRTPSRGLP